jgi:hypothetical protein
MYKPEYRKYFLNKINQTVSVPGFGGDEYNQWVQKHLYQSDTYDLVFLELAADISTH